MLLGIATSLDAHVSDLCLVVQQSGLLVQKAAYLDDRHFYPIVVHSRRMRLLNGTSQSDCEHRRGRRITEVTRREFRTRDSDVVLI